MYGKTVLKDGHPMNESIIDEKGSLKPGAFIPFENMKVIPKDYIKQSERKKILLITDDIRVHSGVAQIGRETVLGTLHHFNWVAIAGAIKHPETGKVVDMSTECNKLKNIDDSYVK